MKQQTQLTIAKIILASALIANATLEAGFKGFFKKPLKTILFTTGTLSSLRLSFPPPLHENSEPSLQKILDAQQTSVVAETSKESVKRYVSKCPSCKEESCVCMERVGCAISLINNFKAYCVDTTSDENRAKMLEQNQKLFVHCEKFAKLNPRELMSLASLRAYKDRPKANARDDEDNSSPHELISRKLSYSSPQDIGALE